MIEGQFSQFQSQPESARAELQNYLASEHGDKWHELIIGHHERKIQEIKASGDREKGEQWAFKTIFQKALLRLGKQYALSLTEEEKMRLGNVHDLMNFMDELYERDLLRVLSPLPGSSHRFWTSIAINPGNKKIKVSTQTEKRIEEFLRLAYVGRRYAKHMEKIISEKPSENTITPRAIFKDISTQNSQLLWGTHNTAKSILSFMSDNAKSLSVAIAEAEDNDTITDEELKKLKKQFGRDRLIRMLSSCWIQVIDEKDTEATNEAQADETFDEDMI